MMDNTNSKNHESLINEYGKTQEMIIHYDDITLRFGSIIQSGVLILIGLSFGILSKERSMFLHLFPFVIIFVSLTNYLVYLWFKRHRAISQIKIQRILEIEKQLGWKQFLLVDKAFSNKTIRTAPARTMIIIYLFVEPLILAVAYLVILFCV
jgi:hypothetical protein